MKKLLFVASVIALSIFSFITFARPASAATTNLILNPSFETSTNGQPANWSQGGWGTNTSAFSYSSSTAHTGSMSATVNVSNYVSGDAKWYADPVSITPSAAYTYSDYYISNVATRVVAAFTDASNVTSYVELPAVAASSSWALYSTDFVAPSTAKSVVIYHLLDKNGSLTIDDVSLSLTVAPTPPPVTSNLVPNPSLETSSNGAMPNGWQHDKWGTNTSTFAYIKTDGHSGTRSAKVTISKYVSGDAKWYFTPITNISDGKQYAFSVWYKTNTQPRTVVMYTDASGNDQYMTIARPLPAANSSTTWTNFSTTFYLPQGATSATVFMLISSNGWLQVDDYSIIAQAPVGYSRPIVSLTFDDGLASTYNNGLPILKQYGFVSTQYLVSGLLNTSGYMTTAMAAAFKTQGSELGSHTVTHPILTTLSSTKLTQELSNSQSTLRSLFGTDVAIDFATPSGEYNQTVLNSIKKYYQSHRSVDVGYNSKDDFDPYNIRVQNIQLSTTPAEVSSWVAQAIKDKTWLVIVYHGVDNGGDAYSVTPTNFATEMSALQSTGVSVQTISQALAEIKAQL